LVCATFVLRGSLITSDLVFYLGGAQLFEYVEDDGRTTVTAAARAEIVMSDFLMLTSDATQYEAIAQRFDRTSPVDLEAAGQSFHVTELHFAGRERDASTPRILLALLKSQGRAQAAVQVATILSVLKPKVILLVGPASGVKGTVGLGDIVVSSRIGELTPSMTLGKTGYDIHHYFKVSDRLVNFCRNFNPEHSKTFKQHEEKISLRFGPTLCTHYVGKLPELAKSRLPTNIAAIDMESAGIAAAIEAVPDRMEFLAVFCIADFTDASKSSSDLSSALEKAASFSAALVEAASSSDQLHFLS
jgi:nucleoside phosphorylase